MPKLISETCYSKKAVLVLILSHLRTNSGIQANSVDPDQTAPRGAV